MNPTLGKRGRGESLSDDERVKAQAAFLGEYARRGNISDGCKKARVDRSTFYYWTEHDEQFSLLYNQAREAYNDALRAEIHRRAVVGVIEPIYQGGKLAGNVRKFSDVLLIFQAKARMPEYRDKDAAAGEGVPEKMYGGFDPSLV